MDSLRTETRPELLLFFLVPNTSQTLLDVEWSEGGREGGKGLHMDILPRRERASSL